VISAADGRIETRLAGMPDSAGAPAARAVGGRAPALLARRHDLVGDEALTAVEELSVLRDLAADSPGGEIGVERAREGIALAGTVPYAL
jgi:hypothetical protein